MSAEKYAADDVRRKYASRYVEINRNISARGFHLCSLSLWVRAYNMKVTSPCLHVNATADDVRRKIREQVR